MNVRYQLISEQLNSIQEDINVRGPSGIIAEDKEVKRKKRIKEAADLFLTEDTEQIVKALTPARQMTPEDYTKIIDRLTKSKDSIGNVIVHLGDKIKKQGWTVERAKDFGDQKILKATSLTYRRLIKEKDRLQIILQNVQNTLKHMFTAKSQAAPIS